MKKIKVLPYILGAITALLFSGFCLYVFCPAINVHNVGLWVIIDIAILLFIVVVRLTKGFKDFGWITVKKRTGSKGRTKKFAKFNFNIKYYILPIILTLLIIVIGITGSTVFNATSYSEILKVKDSDFSVDLSESVGTDSIALMDTASARMLGGREIGALSDVVSQFNVSYDYTQIDYNGNPIKVSALEYAGFFKWMNNNVNGI